MNRLQGEALMTAEEAANFLQVSKARVYRMAGTGLLRFAPHRNSRMRFLRKELESYRWHAEVQGAQLRLPERAPRRQAQGAPLSDTLPDRTMTAREAAAYLGMKLDTFYWRVRHQGIPFLPPLGQRGKRFRHSDLAAHAHTVENGDTTQTHCLPAIRQ